MITLRFPTGFSIQYNAANFLQQRGSGERVLYTDDPNRGGQWVASVYGDCIVEVRKPCRTYNASHDPSALGRAALQAIEARELDGWTLARIKIALQDFDARRRSWK